MKADQTYQFTKDKLTLVPLGDPRGRFTAYLAGQEIPDELAERSGLKEVSVKQETKKATEPEHKIVKPAPNKSGAADGPRKD